MVLRMVLGCFWVIFVEWFLGWFFVPSVPSALILGGFSCATKV